MALTFVLSFFLLYKTAIIEKMKCNWLASCDTDDHSSQWEFSKKATTAVKYNWFLSCFYL